MFQSFSTFTSSSFCAGLNHLLRQNAWATERLQAQAGKHVTITGPAPLPAIELLIDARGLLEASPSPDHFDLRIALNPPALLKIAMRDRNALHDIELSGNAALAAIAQELFTRLEWDVEEDLSRVVGDVAAQIGRAHV